MLFAVYSNQTKESALSSQPDVLRRVLVTARRRWLIFLAGLLICVRFASNAAEAPRWVVVTAPAFRAELAPLIEHRRQEGMTVVVIETTEVLSADQLQRGDGAALQQHLARLWRDSVRTNYLVLAGAFPARNLTNAAQIAVPALPGTIGRMKGQAGDYGYCLADSNGVPTVAVGRFPARTVEELRDMVEKTLELERERGPSPWRNRLLLLAGESGGGSLADMMVEQQVGPRLERLHSAWSLRAIFSGAMSRFALPADQLRDGMVRALEDGALFSMYLGHSTAVGMWLTGETFLTRDDWSRLGIARGRGVFFTCGCFSCQIQGRDGSGYGIAAMRNPRGPAAVIGAVGESYAAPGLLALDGLLQCLNRAPFPLRLADYWLAVQTGLARGEIDAITFGLYDQFDGTQGKVPLAVQRREHLEMWLLLGDPALHLPVLRTDVSVQIKDPIRPGHRVVVTGTLPAKMTGAKVRVTLERPTGSLPVKSAAPVDASADAATRRRLAIEDHEHANDFILAAVEATLSADTFTGSLEVPANIPWPKVVVRATATTGADMAVGVATFPVSR